jgi:hypothetical protein
MKDIKFSKTETTKKIKKCNISSMPDIASKLHQNYISFIN